MVKFSTEIENARLNKQSGIWVHDISKKIIFIIATALTPEDYNGFYYNSLIEIYVIMQNQKNHLSYILGLDIGIASVGWSALGKEQIIDLGVRIFDRAETTDGESLNKARRNSRLVRSRLRHRAWRLLKLARLLKREGVIADNKLFLNKTPVIQSLWQLRVDALDRQLSGEEWARVIYHICKHRGFWFARKNEADKSEGGDVKKGLKRTLDLMSDKKYRTAAEMMLAEFPDKQRNKRGGYSQSLGREMLADELATLFAAQRELGNPFTQKQLELAILDTKTGLVWQQKPALSGQRMLAMIGPCTFEKQEYRAPKHSWSAERFVWLTKLNNLRVSIAGNVRPLLDEERIVCIKLPYEKAKLTYKQLKDKLVKTGFWPEEVRFLGLNYRDDTKDPETANLMELKSWHELRKTLEAVQLKTEWQSIATQPELLDQIGVVLSVYKSDDEIRQQLTKLRLQSPVIEALLSLSFNDFIRLSLKALKQILPGMERGLRYDQACDEAGYVHSKPNSPLDDEDKLSLLPSFYVGRDASGKMLRDTEQDLPNNPVVLRSLNQARIITNAIIRKYGPPMAVHIEMARDLSRPLDERQKIEKEQKAFGERNEKDRERFAEHFGRRPTAKEFKKWQFYNEQQCKCAYSLAPIDLNRLIDDATYAEIDHALPYSRSFDDSKNNKVLVLTKENRDKGNQTPYEYLDGASDSAKWQIFNAFVMSNKCYRQAKRDRLLRKQFGKEDASGFKERNLQDTRYACRYFKNFVEQNLALHSTSEAKRCVVVNGQLTSFLRARWGLAKLRAASDRHHAIDAVVVAACSHGMVKRLADYARRKELHAVRSGFVDLETGEIINPTMLDQLERHFPRPWENFENELCARAGIDRGTGNVRDDLSLEQMREHLAALGYSEDMLAQVKPLFVSRAPKRRNSGAAHEAKIRSIGKEGKLLDRKLSAIKTPLTELTLKKLKSIVGYGRDFALIDAIRTRLEQFDGDGKKAFASSQPPLLKPSKDNAKAPVIRSVKILQTQKSGVLIRGGIAENGDTLRIDVFVKAGKFYLIPLYVHHRVAGILPNKAIDQGKVENDWTVVDERFDFLFSVYPNDLLLIKQREKSSIQGYYAGCDRATGTINVWLHDRNVAKGTEGLIRSIGVRTALSIEKFHVDELGNIFLAKPEARRGLA